MGGLVLALSVSLGVSSLGHAGEQATATEFALGAGSVAATVIWGPVKLAYAGGGLVTGGLAWALTGGRKDVARAIMQPAIRGDYIVTPDQLVGRKPITFVSRDPRTEPYPY